MKREELIAEVKLSYYDLVQYLLKKYGSAKVDYYCNESMRSKNKKIPRSSEGLFCHHIDEDRGSNLSSPQSAQKQPFAWQRADRLVYCNAIEHLLLHIKIAILRQKREFYNSWDLFSFFTTGGVFEICAFINDRFFGDSDAPEWANCCYRQIEENRLEYMALLKAVVCYLNDHYYGEKQNVRFFQIGNKANSCLATGTITGISDFYNEVTLLTPTGNEVTCPAVDFAYSFSFQDMIQYISGYLSKGFDSFYKLVFDELLIKQCNDTVYMFTSFLSIDFKGYGFPQYTNYPLPSFSESINVDQYISNAFPAYMPVSYEISLDSPVPQFWKGDFPQIILDKNCFFIVRVNVMFNLRHGETPFIRYKNRDYSRYLKDPPSDEIDEENNLLFRHGVVLVTSDFYNREEGRYYPAYKDAMGKLHDSSVVITLTKDDFYLFRKRYYVKKMEILDGLYFA